MSNGMTESKILVLEGEGGDFCTFCDPFIHSVTKDTIFVTDHGDADEARGYPRTKFNIMCLMEYWGYSSEVADKASFVTKTRNGMVSDVLDQSVNIIDWSVRVHNVLRRLGITKIRDLVALSHNDLMKTRNLGIGSVSEIERRLSEIGVSLKEGGTNAL